MKKKFLLGGVLLATTFSFAQQAQNMLIEKNQSQKVVTRTVTNYDRAPGDIIGSVMDFSDAGMWVIDNSGTDPGGWVIGADGPSGAFSGGMGVIESTSAGDFAMFDADTYPGLATITMASPIDLSSYSNVAFEFESYYRNYTGTAWFEISIDGTTWTSFQVHELLPLNESTANPEFVSVNITDLVAGEATVWARFTYDSTDDYAWMVDDVRFTEGFDDQLVIGAPFLSAGTQALDYYMIPTNQAQDFTFGAYATNNGTNDQVNTTLNVVVNDGASDVYDENSTPGTIAAFMVDSLELTTPAWTPTEGTFTVSYNVASDAADQAPDDNKLTLETIKVGGNVYARDNGVSTGSFGFLGGSSPVTVMANYFEFSDDFGLGAVDVLLSSGTDVGEIMFAEIRKWDGTEFVFVASSADYEVGVSDPGEFVRIQLDEIVECVAGDIFLIGAGHYGSSALRVQVAQVASGVVVFSDGDGFQQNSVFMVRAVEQFVGIAEQGKIGNVTLFPNPTAGNSTLSYSLTSTEDVSLIVTDISGKQIATYSYGSQNQGKYQQVINTDEMSDGLYFYTLKIGEKEVTNKLIISKK